MASLLSASGFFLQDRVLDGAFILRCPEISAQASGSLRGLTGRNFTVGGTRRCLELNLVANRMCHPKVREIRRRPCQGSLANSGTSRECENNAREGSRPDILDIEKVPERKQERRVVEAIGKGAVALAVTLLQLANPLPEEGSLSLPGGWGLQPANAVLYSPDTKVPRSAEVALRRAIPAVNPTMKKTQESLEDIFFLLRIPQRKPYGTMEANVKKAIQAMTEEKAAILGMVPPAMAEKAAESYDNIVNGKGGLEGLLAAIQIQDADKVAGRLANVLDNVAELEILQAPGLPFLVPAQYASLPRLTGRATVEFSLQKGDGSSFTLQQGGGPQDTGVIEVVLDGYSAPMTAGNVVNLVLKQSYDGISLKAGNQAIILDSRSPPSPSPDLPLEILPAGEFQPIYRTALDVQDGELPVLPLSVYGAVAMSHSPESESLSSPSQFFFYLYDKRNSGLGGLSFEEGQFSVFGYVTKGKELLAQLKTGDVIQSARITAGLEHYVASPSG